MCVYLFTCIPELDNSDDCVEPTRECRRSNEEALQLSLSSGRYPEYLDIEGPQDRNNPQACVILWIFYFYYGPSPSVI